MKGVEFPGDNVDRAAQLRDVMADVRADREEIKRLKAALEAIASMNGLTLICSPHDPEEVQRAYSWGAANAFAQAAGIAKEALSEGHQ